MTSAAGSSPLTFQSARPKAPVGLLVALACGGVFVGACLLAAAIFAASLTALRTSGAYQLALSTATRAPAVVAALGAPVQAGWLTLGQVEVTAAGGRANLEIPVSGPRGAGTIRACASKGAGKWTLTCLTVHVAGRSAPLQLVAATP